MSKGISKIKTIGLTYDLRRDYLAQGYLEEEVAEFDSDETITFLEETIQCLGYKTDRIGSAKALCSRLVAGDKWDLVFNIAEGISGRFRESQVPAMLDIYGIKYTFSDPLVCAITLDKSITKQLISYSRLPTPRFKVINETSDLSEVCLEYPLFAKPLAEGTGKGIDHNSRIKSAKELSEVCEYPLDRYSQPVLVEEFLPGREFTAAVLGNGPDAYVLGIMEIKLPYDKKGAIYSYVAKEECEKLVNYCPCPKGLLYDKIAKLALDSYRVLQCRDAARVDIRCDGKEEPCFLEINPLPGLHPSHSDLPMIATQEGMPYCKLLNSIITSAFSRP
ncbi:MAG: ATP-grasp domain-containing protein [Candidatus Brocadiia bacterium]|nr:MAG: ATP-grasp domain-containing protein [Candidatus Brocadiia bacterium]